MKKLLKTFAILSFCAALSGCGTEKEEQILSVNEPVIMGSTYFDEYAVVLRMYEGRYESDLTVGPFFGPNWIGKCEMVIIDRDNGKEITKYQMTDWSGEMRFQSQDSLNLTDYNNDGTFELLVGQYGASNADLYHMYYITEDLYIGYYNEIGELTISSKELSPMLETEEDTVKYTVFNNAVGENVEKEIAFDLLEIDE